MNAMGRNKKLGVMAVLVLSVLPLKPLVVIFQEELRRFFERIATWKQIRTGKVGPANLGAIDGFVFRKNQTSCLGSSRSNPFERQGQGQ